MNLIIYGNALYQFEIIIILYIIIGIFKIKSSVNIVECFANTATLHIF